ncbi:hypothetical protein BS78_05G089000 [Paspalum vaginatum]|nr:hypothetical protein BS78_05G089000 [Paspalum vaginatum]
MSLDTKLILDALNHHFDELEAKMDRWFSGGAFRGQAASRLPTTAAAPTAIPLSPSPEATASPTSCDITLVNSGGEQAMAHHIFAADDATSTKSTGCSTGVSTPTPAPVTNTTLAPPSAPSATTSPSIGAINSAPTTATSSAPTTALASVSATRLAALPDASTGPLAPSPQGVEEEIRSYLPSKCSTKCSTHDIDMLKPVETLTIVWNAPPTSANIPRVFMDCSLEHSQKRYITIITPSLSSGVALPCVSPTFHEYQKMFEGTSVWNPPLLSFWTSFSSMWVTMQQRPPWPPPIQCIMLSDSVQLRPTPWPSFGCHGVFMKLESFRSPVISCLEWKDRKGCKSPNEWHINDGSVQGACQALSLGWSLYLDIDLKLMGSQHTLQGILVMNAHDLHWLLFTYHQETVQCKLSWVSLMCINIHSCYFPCTISTWQPAVFSLIWWPPNTKLLFFDTLCNHFKMNQTVAPIVCSSYEPVTLWEIPWTSSTLFTRCSIGLFLMQ